MVDKQNGQQETLTLDQAEEQASDIESQVLAREQELATREASIRGEFVPGTIESQFALGSGQALREARKGLEVERTSSLRGIFESREALEPVRKSITAQRERIESARAVKRERERQIRVAKVERKISLREFAERPREAGQIIPEGAIQSLPEGGFLITETATQSLLEPLEVQPIQTLQEGGILFQELRQEPLQSLAPVSTFQRAEQRVSSFIPSLEDVKEFQLGATQRVTGRSREDIIARETRSAQDIPFGFGALGGVGKGAFEQIQQRPIQTATTFAVGLGFGAGIRGGGIALSRFAPSVLPVAEKVVGIGGIGLGGLFVGQTGLEVATAPSERRAEIIGARGIELTAFIGGAGIGTRGATKVQDIIRTRGLTEVPISDIIAPEFFAGQTFPTIARGQTAGSLRAEFLQPIASLGEVGGRARGFTALPVEPLAEIPKGSSFVFGGFSAPKISPRFLRVGGEERTRLFAFSDFLGGGRPTAVRTTFQGLDFAPGVTPRTRRPSGRVSREQLEFFGGGFTERTGVLVADFGEPLAQRGTSFIPFVKTEKEAILPFGTQTIETGRGFFFRFEGRRIPISERLALQSTTDLTTSQFRGVETIGEVLASSSRIPRRSLVSPIELGFGARGFLSSSRATPSSRSFLPSSRSFISSFDSGFRSLRSSRVSRGRSSRPSRIDSFPDLVSPPSRSSRRRPTTRPSRPTTRPSIATTTSELFEDPFRPTPIGRGRRKPAKKKGKKKPSRGRRIAPSFTASALDIRGIFPRVDPSLGISPFSIRVIPNGRGRRTTRRTTRKRTKKRR